MKARLEVALHFCLMFFASLPISNIAAGEDVRTWHDSKCIHRVRAVLVGVEADIAFLKRDSDAQIVKVPLPQLSNGDKVFLSPLPLVAKAAASVRRSPYKPVPGEINNVQRLLASRDVPFEEFNQIALAAGGASGDRNFGEIVGRWVSIEGLQYLVDEVVVDPQGRGLSQVVVVDHSGRRRRVTRDDYCECRPIEMTILPRFWRQPTYRVETVSLRNDSMRGFRGPPTKSMLANEYEWKDRLVFDTSTGLWTDLASRKGHELLAMAEEAWRSADALTLADDADYLLFHKETALALQNYDRALDLLSDRNDRKGLILLRRGYAKLMLKRFDEALTDFDSVIMEIRTNCQDGTGKSTVAFSCTPASTQHVASGGDAHYSDVLRSAAYELRARTKSKLASSLRYNPREAKKLHEDAIEDAKIVTTLDYRNGLALLAPRACDGLAQIRRGRDKARLQRIQELALRGIKSQYPDLSLELRMDAVLDLSHRVKTFHQKSTDWIEASAIEARVEPYVWNGDNDPQVVRAGFKKQLLSDEQFKERIAIAKDTMRGPQGAKEIVGLAMNVLPKDDRSYLESSSSDPLSTQLLGLDAAFPQMVQVTIQRLERMYLVEHRYSVYLQETDNYLEGLEHAARAAEVSALLKKLRSHSAAAKNGL